MNKEFIKAEKKELNEDEGTLVGIASKAIVDRDNELILNDAWKLDSYRKNPIIMVAHDYQSLPVGKCQWIKSSSDGLRFKCKFASTERGREVYKLYQEGILNAFSVGFKANPGGVVDNPSDVRYKGVKRLYKDVELLEISCVAIPANNQALCEYVKAGKVQTKSLNDELIEILEIKDMDEDTIEIKMDGINTDNWLEVPVEQGDSHKACKKKSMDVSLKEGIQGVYCEDDKQMLSYKFDPEKWVIEKAKEYVDEHHKKSFDWAEEKLVDIEGKSYFDDEGDLVIVKIEKTDNFIHVPAPDEEGKHTDHKIRTVELSKKDGVKGAYCIDDKKMINYIFSTDKEFDWTVEKAKKWVDDHSKEKSYEVYFEGDEVIVKDPTDVPVTKAEDKEIMPNADEAEEDFMTRCMKEMMGEGDAKENACKLMWAKKSAGDIEMKTEEVVEEKTEDITVKAAEVKTPGEEIAEVIKSLQVQIAEMKCQMEGIKVPDQAATSPVIKTADADGNPSLYDITCAINCALNDPKNMHVMNPEGERCYYSVIDVYTTEFPGGHAVYSESCSGEACEYYQIDYDYDLAERKVTFPEGPKPVLQSWVEDRYGEQEPVEKEASDIVVKEGRVLSSQNRQLLINCMQQMKEAMDAMQGLMSVTDPNPTITKPTVAITVEDLFKSEDVPVVKEEAKLEIKEAEADTIELDETVIEAKDFLEVEDDELEIDEAIIKSAVSNAMKSSFKLDIGNVVKETIARRLGRAVL